MTSRDRILASVRQAKPQRTAELPDVRSAFSTDSDLFATLKSNLEDSGANVRRIDKSSLDVAIRGLVSAGGLAYYGDYPIEGFSDVASLHSVNDLDGSALFACSGQLGVAENGAIWLSDSNFVHRAALFLPESVAIVIDENEIVPTMHEAYGRIKIDEDGFGIFVAGPSKTADIEQSLVIGAHGPRSLHVFVTT